MNNYNQSSSGINIEFNAHYDTGLAQIYFDENFTVKQYSGYRQHSILIYTASNFGLDWCEKVILKGYPKGIIADLANYHNDVKDFIERLHYLTGKNCRNITLKDLENILPDLADYLGLYDEFELAEKVISENNYELNFDVVESRGYSQGDYAKVIIPHKLYKLFEIDQNPKFFTETIDHFLWDRPISGRLEVDDKEFYIDEYLENYYEWDKYSFLQNIKKDIPENAHEWLSENLPENLDYI